MTPDAERWLIQHAEQVLAGMIVGGLAVMVLALRALRRTEVDPLDAGVPWDVYLG